MATPASETTQPLPLSENSYKLPRDDVESIRLSAQHYALTQRQGWLLHPTIQKAISAIENPQIADVACGTGIWAFELAERLPNTFVTGLDVSTNQFPPNWTWPHNSVLGTLDLTGEVPSEYLARFDVVHCRLLLATGPTVDWKVFASNFRKLLKPGGYLQWEEVPYPMMRTVEPILKNGRPTGKYDHTVIRWDTMANFVHLPYKNGWFSQFKSNMQQLGDFGEVEQFDTPVHPRTQKLEMDATVGGALTATEHVLRAVRIEDKNFLAKVSAEMSQIDKHKSEGKMLGWYFIVGVAKAV